MVLAIEGATNCVESVGFSFITDEELLRSSRVKITNPILLDGLSRPVPFGMYDPAMGPLNEKSLCKSCGQTSKHCPGHFGHIELVSPIYNPLTFNILSKILQKTCFSCHCFRSSRREVELRMTPLKLIKKGNNIAKAKDLDSLNPDEPIPSDDGDEDQCCSVEKPGENWTSLQFSEAMSVLSKFLNKRQRKCQLCEYNNPEITKPIFGWFHKKSLSAGEARANVILGEVAPLASETIDDDICLGIRDTTDDENNASADKANTDAKRRNRKNRMLSYKLAENNTVFESLLPSEVKDRLELLWENEKNMCSYISDMQDQGFGKKAGASMFFLENIFVPPIKFRPPLKGGDKVMEHPQTILLTKVLQSNIYLGDAH